MKGLIISSGYIKEHNLLKKMVFEHDYIVCADGGVDHLMNIGEIPNAVIGDLDSISDKGLKFIQDNDVEVLKFPVMKDKTDTELAILHILDKGIDRLTLMGVTGSRLDHTMANILLLKKLHEKGIDARIVDDNNIIYIANERMEVEKREDYNISIIPINDDGIVVSLIGFLYPLNKKYIEFASTLGISNCIVEDFGTILIHRGKALVIESID
ncbi:MAG: thiamine diphosphokinase [Tissierellaceae bacterium]